MGGGTNDADITQLKLQKLLYYAKGAVMRATDGVPLFADRMEAWAHGPVVVDVYHATKAYKNGPIDPDEFVAEDFNWDDYRDVEQELIEVWNEYGPYSAWALRNKTHRESPWLKIFREDERSIEISDADLKKYFCE
ncbi:Panacea domain-containing protein [Corynebacterium cystitidis]|uniref:Panacea domain-containing protein n=1 Tax=Corynebacterium cystitidis TaxID=35757 RepID=UPI0027BA8497|nr:type II toxin-antitoxin system antitoxin SocA domain-containing protein [Corynebacterium cystitidis]